MSRTYEEIDEGISKALDKMEKNWKKLVALREELLLLDSEKKKKTHGFNLQPKSFWKNEGITNAEGRKAFIYFELDDLNEKIQEVKVKIEVVECDLGLAEKEFDFLMQLLRATNV